MSKELSKNQRIRISLQVDRGTKELLEKLSERSSSSSLTETVRRALALYDLFWEHQEEQGEVVFLHKDGAKETLKII